MNFDAARLLSSLRENKKKILIALIFSVLFSFLFFLPDFIAEEYGWVRYFGYVLVGTAFFTPLCVLAFSLINKIVEKKSAKIPALSGNAVFFISLACLWLVFFLYFLSHYPCLASNDTNDTLKQVLGLPFESNWFRYDGLNNHHPVAYVFLVSLFVMPADQAGNLDAGIAAFTVFQLSFLAASFAYLIKTIYEYSSSKALAICSILFFLLNPLVALYSITLWKDIPFAAAMLLFSIQLFKIVRIGEGAPSKALAISFVVLSFCVAFLRNNGLYILFATFVLLAILVKERRKLFITYGTSIVLIVTIIQGPVFTLCGIQGTHFSESVGIPLQQIARTVVSGGSLTEKQTEFIENILPLSSIEERYSATSPNRIKFAPDFSDEYLESHKLEFLITWAQIMPHNLGIYLAAWSDETMGYWNTFTNDWLVADTSYALVDTQDSEPTNFLANIPLFNRLGSIDSIFLDSFRQFVYPVYNIACMVWFLLFAAATQLAHGRLRSFTLYVPFIMSWATLLLAAPTFCEFRYLFSLHVAFPLLLMLLLYPIEEQNRGIEVEDKGE